MWAIVLGGQDGAWEAGPRSAAELKEAATHYERAAALCPAPEMKAELAGDAALLVPQPGRRHACSSPRSQVLGTSS